MPDITGRLQESGGSALASWKVELRRQEPSSGIGWLPHGSATTNASGDFVLTVPFLGVLFFGSLVIAGITSLISVIEVVISAVRDKFDTGRLTATLVVVVPRGDQVALVTEYVEGQDLGGEPRLGRLVMRP